MTNDNQLSQVMTAKDSPDTLLKALIYFIKHPNVYLFGLSGLVALIWRIKLGNFNLLDLGILLFILLAWPFMEWRLHIKVLHMKPRTRNGKAYYPQVARKHREHHQEPWRLDLVFLLPKVLFAIPIVFVLANIIFPTPQAFTVCFVGYLMTVNYEWNHFITHTRVQARSAWYKTMYRNHRLHHFKHERYWYGFSAPWPDTIFGTNPNPDTVESSENCKDLGVAIDTGAKR